MNQDRVLDGAEGTHGSAEDPAAEKREHQRDDEEYRGGNRDGVTAVEEGERDVLNRADRTDAPIPHKAEVDQGRNHQDEDGPAASPRVDQVRSEQQRRHEHNRIDVPAPDRLSRRRGRTWKLVSALEFRRRETNLTLRPHARNQQSHQKDYGTNETSHSLRSTPLSRYGWSAGTRLNACEGQAAAIAHSLQFLHRS